jgi:hypothetical protein
MTRRIRLGMLAAVGGLALALCATALAAYTTPTLKVSQTGTTTRIAATVAATDDATARATIYVPPGTQLTLSQAPGTKLGTADAQAAALDLGGALLPLAGDIIVAPPGAVAAPIQAACTQGAAPAATWLMNLVAAGQPLTIPVFVVLTSGTEAALGSAKLLICLGPPDVPAGTPGRAAFGAKLVNATLTLSGVVGPSPLAPWVALWTPWQAGNGQVNAAGTVASPAVIAPGALTIARRILAKRIQITGSVSQAQQPIRGTNVVVLAGKTRTAMRRIGTVVTRANGTYVFNTLNKGPFFRTRVVLDTRAAPQLCQALAGQLPVPCINSQVSGFTQLSRIVRR